jgi:hypothetical protein
MHLLCVAYVAARSHLHPPACQSRPVTSVFLCKATSSSPNVQAPPSHTSTVGSQLSYQPRQCLASSPSPPLRPAPCTSFVPCRYATLSAAVSSFIAFTAAETNNTTPALVTYRAWKGDPPCYVQRPDLGDATSTSPSRSELVSYRAWQRRPWQTRWTRRQSLLVVGDPGM